MFHMGTFLAKIPLLSFFILKICHSFSGFTLKFNSILSAPSNSHSDFLFKIKNQFIQKMISTYFSTTPAPLLYFPVFFPSTTVAFPHLHSCHTCPFLFLSPSLCFSSHPLLLPLTCTLLPILHPDPILKDPLLVPLRSILT